MSTLQPVMLFSFLGPYPLNQQDLPQRLQLPAAPYFFPFLVSPVKLRSMWLPGPSSFVYDTGRDNSCVVFVSRLPKENAVE